MTSPTTTITVGSQIHQALWARFVAPILDGSEPYVHQLHLSGVEDPMVLFPPCAPSADVTLPDGRVVLVSVGGWTAYVSRWGGVEVDVWVRAADAELLSKAIAEIRANAPSPELDEDSVPVEFWQVTDHAYTTSRSIDAPSWSSVAGHYPAEVRAQLAGLVEHRPAVADGRIVLWHGPPGTGKTTAIRALAREWRDRCRVQVVLDPDVVLQRSSILMEVLLGHLGDEEAWRVLVIEDADELVRADAKDRVGQALSRLLNVGDGIVGQGLRVMVLITTNEPIGRLHPALSRPGRCLAQIEFRRFTRAEARAWRGADLPPGDDFSLAELLVGPAETAPAAPLRTGMYL